MIALLLGAVLSLALVGAARMFAPGRERLVYAVGLVLTALVYVVFAVAGGASARWAAIESLGVLLYGAAAWGGLRGLLRLLAAGWAAHVAWDVLLHLSGAGAEYTPHWYPWLCVSFDLIMAGAVLASSRRGAADLRGIA
ncbi:MAG TPA: DUF6010 family protein [Pyrinomonadaceae bacterium]